MTLGGVILPPSPHTPPIFLGGSFISRGIMLSKEDFELKLFAKKCAFIMYKSGEFLPDEIKEEFVSFESMDFFHDFSFNCTRVLVAEYLRLLMQEYKIKFIKCELVDSSKIVRNSNTYQYTYELPDNEFLIIASMSGKNVSATGSMYAIADSVYSYYIQSGCVNCKYSEEGCDCCGMNRARKAIHNSDILTFKKTCEPFLKLIGNKLEPLEEFIKWSIQYEKDSEENRDELGYFTLDDDEDDEDSEPDSE
jgi:hypothetical protein